MSLILWWAICWCIASPLGLIIGIGIHAMLAEWFGWTFNEQTKSWE